MIQYFHSIRITIGLTVCMTLDTLFHAKLIGTNMFRQGFMTAKENLMGKKSLTERGKEA